MSTASSGPLEPGGKLMAAMMAAVDAYLEEEAAATGSQSREAPRAWRLAAWQPSITGRLWRRLPWNGRDPVAHR